MKFSIAPVINEAKFSAGIWAEVQAVRPVVEDSMAKRFHELTLANFGIAGVDRPFHWPRLSSDYAKKVKREMATLHVTGTLKAAVKQEGNQVSVSDRDVPYATVHQYGGGNNIPARPYFPIDSDGDCMPYTYGQVVHAAQAKLAEVLRA